MKRQTTNNGLKINKVFFVYLKETASNGRHTKIQLSIAINTIMG